MAEAAEQLTHALALAATLPGTPALRREQIKLQVARVTVLMQVKGHAAPETKAAAERAHVLIEQAEELGEPPDDPLLTILGSLWLLGCKPCVVSTGSDARLGKAISPHSRKARRDRPHHGRAPPNG